MLGLAETTVIASHQYLRLRTPLSVTAENVEVGIAGEPIETRFVLLAVTHGSAGAQIKRDGPGDRKAALDRRIDRGVEGRRPTAAGEANHVEGAVIRESALA